MSYYEPQAWQAPVRQASWEQPPPPSRSEASSTSQREENYAFASQFEEVERAIDNLVKSGKFYPAGPRRDPMMMGGGRAYNDHPRSHGNRSSFSDIDSGRSHSASNLQSFYASQRYQGRQNEGEQMAQAKRRMAAQRERELRNYHQEQQYNRSVLAEMASNKSDRSMSPSAMSEEGRRELIARQHRALYGNEGAGFVPQGMYGDENNAREPSGNLGQSSGGGPRGSSPRGMDPFGMSGQPGAGDNAAQGGAGTQEAGRVEKTGSPTFDGPSRQSTKSATPPTGDEGHSRQVSKSITAPVGGGMAPIGSRPSTQQAPNPGINKRTTSPLPSSLNYGFGNSSNNSNNNNEQSDERAASSNSNSNNQKENSSGSGMGAWGTGSGVWGSNKIGTTSVWG